MAKSMSKAIYDLKNKRIWVAGHKGMVGSALCRRLEAENPKEILIANREQIDLRNQASVRDWMDQNQPDAIFLAAAKVGGIHANSQYPAEFLYDNIAIASHIIEAAHQYGVEKLLFLGSSCIYPKFADQPIQENALLTGSLEPTNEWYAIAKIAGIKLCQAYRRQYGCDFISAMPTNLYGPGDNFHPENSHVVPALIRKIHEAKIQGQNRISVWGSGTPLREFMHVDDCADALVHIMKHYSEAEHINVGSGTDIPISQLAETIMDVVGFSGEIIYDRSKPDGTPRKLMDNHKLKSLGWAPNIDLKTGLQQAYTWYLQQDNT